MRIENDDDACCSISTFFVLSSTELYHLFRSGMSNIYFTKKGVSVIGKPIMIHPLTRVSTGRSGPTLAQFCWLWPLRSGPPSGGPGPGPEGPVQVRPISKTIF